MKYRKLGTTGIDVSAICLGTMNWGQQNTEADAHEQLDYALSQGVNFIDTAEVYPIPPDREKQGRTEEYLGSWLKKRGKHDDLIIASKMAGRGQSGSIRTRDATAGFTKAAIKEAIDGTLSRLGVDYIDLYQLHRPERHVPIFGALNYVDQPDDYGIELEETLEGLAQIIKEGKVRYIGVSNETPWGVMHALELHKHKHLPRVESIQNVYHLTNRNYELGLSEISIRENCGLLAYSPMAAGVLSGKYLGGKWPEGARHTLFERNRERYNPARAQASVQKYVDLAKEHGLTPAQMALAFVNGRDFVTSTIIGATKMEQLKKDIATIDTKLSPGVLEGIEKIHHECHSPAY